MKTIDHDPEEPPRDHSRPPWLIGWVLIALLWLGYLTQFETDWLALCIGLGTGCMLAGWAIEVTGNKVPRSWRS